MNEVSDAIQIIVVSGKAAYVLGEITLKAALEIIKLLNTLYLSKWNGKVSMSRMRQIKGDDFTFINVATEQKNALKYVEKEMKDHGILFAKLPDLCGGDGRTQYVIPSSDAVKFKAFLLDHANGKYADLKVGPISAQDYIRTRTEPTGKQTPEAARLEQSALETKNIEMKRIPEKIQFRQSLQKHGVSEKNRAVPYRGNVYQKLTKYTQAVQLTLPEVTAVLKRHDSFARQKNHAGWFVLEPEKMHTRWGMYRIQGESNMVIVPRQDIMMADGTGKKTGVTIYDTKQYIRVNLRTGKQTLTDGKQIRSGLRQMMQENERSANKTNVIKMQTVLKNTGKKR